MKKIRSEAWRKNFGWEVVDGKSRDFTDKENDFWVKSENFRDLMSCTDRICTKKLEIRDAQEKTIREIINVCLVMIGK